MLLHIRVTSSVHNTVMCPGKLYSLPVLVPPQPVILSVKALMRLYIGSYIREYDNDTR